MTTSTLRKQSSAPADGAVSTESRDLGLTEVLAAITRWSAEAATGAPVTDSQLCVMAGTGDMNGLRTALEVNRRWRLALACGDARALTVELEAAAEMVA